MNTMENTIFLLRCWLWDHSVNKMAAIFAHIWQHFKSALLILKHEGHPEIMKALQIMSFLIIDEKLFQTEPNWHFQNRKSFLDKLKALYLHLESCPCTNNEDMRGFVVMFQHVLWPMNDGHFFMWKTFNLICPQQNAINNTVILTCQSGLVILIKV